MNGKRTFWLLTAGVFLLGVVLSCTKNPVSNGGTETGNAIGHLAKADGTPAAGVTVYFYDVENNPREGLAKAREAGLSLKAFAVAGSTTTDDSGNFADSLPDGIYNVMASDDTTGVYVDSIEIAGDTTTVPDDTLKTLGSLRGTIALERGADVRTVFILVMGTYVWTAPSATGDFALSNMAEGEYSFRILTTLDKYAVLDTSFSVLSGKTDTLSDTITLKYTGIPTVTGVGITYDTLRQIVTVAWSKDDPSLVKGYNVYRKHSDSDFVKINKTLVTDTVYRDSTALQDQTYEYKVTAVDNNDNEGDKREGDTVTIVSAFKFLKSIGDSGTGTGQLRSPGDIAVDSAGNFWVTDNYRNKVLKFDSSGTFMLEWGTAGSGPGELNYPFGIDIDANQDIYIAETRTLRIQKFDAAGNLLMIIDSASIQAVWDVSVDDSGYIYCYSQSDNGEYYVKKYNPTGDSVRAWNVGRLLFQRSILAFNDRIYVAGAVSVSGQAYSNILIEIFQTSGTAISTINVRQGGETGVIDIRDMDADANGLLYAVDPENAQVRVFDPNTNFLTSFGRKGTGPGMFSWIQAIAVTSNNTLAITDKGRIHLFTRPSY